MNRQLPYMYVGGQSFTYRMDERYACMRDNSLLIALLQPSLGNAYL